jgi:hypothetical protein
MVSNKRHKWLKRSKVARPAGNRPNDKRSADVVLLKLNKKIWGTRYIIHEVSAAQHNDPGINEGQRLAILPSCIKWPLLTCNTPSFSAILLVMMILVDPPNAKTIFEIATIVPYYSLKYRFPVGTLVGVLGYFFHVCSYWCAHTLLLKCPINVWNE